MEDPTSAEYLNDQEKILKDKLKTIKEFKKDGVVLSVAIPNTKIEEDLFKFRQCYYDCINVLKEYSDIPEDYYSLISLWILGTYLHDEFETFPLLFINASKGSGKSRLLKLISAMSKKGKIVLDLKESVMFRTAKGCTLCIDEFESVGSKELGTLRTLLNAAYKKGIAVERMRKVTKQGQEEYVVDRFDLYTPVAMANIWGIEEVLSDRCLVILLDKSNHPFITKLIEDFDKHPVILNIKRTLEQIQCSLCSVVTEKNIGKGWNSYIKDKYITTLTTLYTYDTLTALTTPKELESLVNDTQKLVYRSVNELIDFNKIDAANLDGRNLELFFPLFVLGKMIGEDIFDNTIKSAKRITEEKKNEEFAESKDISLLDFIAGHEDYRNIFVNIHDLTKEFKAFTSMDEEEIKWMNSKWLGRALKRLKVILQKRRLAKGIEVNLDIDKAKTNIKKFKEDIKKEHSELKK